MTGPQTGQRLDGAVFRNEDSLAARRGRLVRDVNDRIARRLRENGRRFTGVAEIDGAGVHRFEELRTCWKLRPGDLVAERLQLFLPRPRPAAPERKPLRE